MQREDSLDVNATQDGVDCTLFLCNPELQLTEAVCLHAMACSVKALMVHGNNLDSCCRYDTVHRARVYSDSSDGSSGVTPVWGSEEEQVCTVGAE